MNAEPVLTYVYAVASVTPGLADAVAGLHGVGGAPVALLTAPGGLGRDGGEGAEASEDPATAAFVVSPVPASQWREEALKAHFEDLDWLEATARAHHHVIQALMDHTTVLPLRMATLYEDDGRALDALRGQRRSFADRLSLLARHAEYGVKVYVRPGTATPAAGPEPPAPQPASPGKAYLQARRAQHHAQEDRYGQARQAAERIAATAARYATHVVRHPAQTGSLARDDSGENVLNDAFLVPDGQAEAFRTAVREAGEDLPGVRIEVTGPWAPYSFAVPPPGPAEPAGPGDRLRGT
ncbi:GvpL/GvpF family gas vesicle protein [Streptomyces sp. NPDC031705]|uniref:GvpL/GvpF family gas vesicle protein n=1 Tax=Streptomyces sp. NPDC031705 TaxID=3155729 RepID=UPI0033CD6EEC